MFDTFNECFASRTVFWELQLSQISLNFKTSSWNLKIRGLGAKRWLPFLLFNFGKSYYVLKPNSSFILLNKNLKFCLWSQKWSRKWNIQHRVIERQALCFRSYTARKLKAKLWLIGALEKKKRALFVFYCNV